jgi:hypothetical protein
MRFQGNEKARESSAEGIIVESEREAGRADKNGNEITGAFARAW